MNTNLKWLEDIRRSQKHEHGMGHTPAMGPVVVGHLPIVLADRQNEPDQVVVLVADHVLE